ncbi:MAG: amidohydrolase family protein [Acidimicrobiia bacterium]
MSLTEVDLPENALAALRSGFAVADSDQHFYEPQDAITRHLEKEFAKEVQWAVIDGRLTLILGGQIYGMVPFPTYDPVAKPGALEEYFRGHNPTSRTLREMVGELEPCPQWYRNRANRLPVLLEQGVDFAWVMPTMAIGLEQYLQKNPASVHATFRSLNRWIEDEWGYATDDHLHVPAALTLMDPAMGEAELDRVLALGARSIIMRPAPVPDPAGWRSLGDPRHDRFWSKVAEAGVTVMFHAADSGYQRHAADWGEHSSFHRGYRQSALTEVMGLNQERPAFDTATALICHGVFDRVPGLKVAFLEVGSDWVPYLANRLQHAYGKMPSNFGSDPVDKLRNNVWVMPFYEDSLPALVDAIGIDQVLYGSDWPHPEGLATPFDGFKDMVEFSEADQRKIMGDNLRKLVFG